MSEDNKKNSENSELVDKIIAEIVPQGQKPVVRPSPQQKMAQSPPIKAKLYYDVKVECMLPATLTFRVLAEDPQQAADLIRGQNPQSVKHRLIGRRDIKLSVYDAGSSMLRWMKNLIG
jgi:hypothetical protein